MASLRPILRLRVHKPRISDIVRKQLNWKSYFGRHDLSNATCLIRPRSLCVPAGPLRKPWLANHNNSKHNSPTYNTTNINISISTSIIIIIIIIIISISISIGITTTTTTTSNTTTTTNNNHNNNHSAGRPGDVVRAAAPEHEAGHNLGDRAKIRPTPVLCICIYIYIYM